MKKVHGGKRVSRILAFFAACILCLQMTLIPAQALEDWSLLSITLSWTDAQGNPVFAMATPVPYGEEQAFWAQVDITAPLDQLTITISHPNHPEYVFDPANGSVLLNVVDSGAAMDMLTAIPITAMANDTFADAYTLYVSTQMMPTDPALDTPVDVTVVYQYDNGEVIDQQTQPLGSGDYTITPSSGLVAGLELTSAQEVPVHVEGGVASPNPVVFTYKTPDVKADVTVVYQYDDGEVIDRTTQSLGSGDHTIKPTSELVAGLEWTSAQEVPVHVEGGVATPDTVIFTYKKPDVPANVTVVYQYEDGEVIDRTTQSLGSGDHTIKPTSELVAGLEWTSAQEVPVHVEGGVATPDTVIFTYKKPDVKANVTVVYQYEDGEVIDQTTQPLGSGDHTIKPTSELVAGLEWTSAQEVPVHVEGGVATPDTVIFTYKKPDVLANVTVVYQYEDGEVIDQTTQSLGSGDHTIKPTSELVAGLEWTSAQEVPVHVEGGVATPDTVIFTYKKPDVPANVTVVYQYEDGTVIDRTTQSLGSGDHTIKPTSELVAGLEWTSAQEVPVHVEGGVATPDTVIFTYKKPDVLANVTVVYQYEDGEVIDQTTQSLGSGDHTIKPTSELVAGLEWTSAQEVPVHVEGGVATPNTVTFTYKKPDVKANVTVVYQYEDDTVIDRTTQSLGSGDHTIKPTSELVAGLELTSAQEVPVHVEGGIATPNTVTFVYKQASTEPVYANIEISFVDKDGNPVASPQSTSLPVGRHTVTAAPEDLLDGYSIATEPNVTVEVYEDGTADPASIAFVYNKVETDPTEEPQPSPASVTVLYLAREDNHEVAAAQTFTLGEGTVPVSATPENLEAGYTLDGAATQDVVVDQQGNASPNPVTFYYVKAQEPTPVAQATITIRYTDVKGNQIAPTETRMLDANNVYAIAPDPSRVPSDYLPLKADTVSVTVNAEGVADVTEVVFVYQPKVTETEIPTGALIQRWGYTTAEKGSINWRDEPSTDGRRLGTLNQNTYVWLLREEVNSSGEAWTKVLYNGQEGYIMSEFLVVLSQAESDYYTESYIKGNGFTPVPTETASPSPKPSPETPSPSPEAPSASPETPSPATPSASPETPSPSPATPSASPETPSPSPATPSASPDTPTPKPAAPTPYVGYALTNQNVALRNGMDYQDTSILTMLERNTLVHVQLQTTDDAGTLWSYCTTTDSNPISGMVLDSALNRISDAEAQAIIQANATPTPSPTAEPPQQQGYAVARGDNVYMRTLPSELSGISHVLSAGEVAYVTGQQYVLNNGTYEIWHVVQYGSEWGYIRADLMRMLDPWEEEQYLNSLKTPAPTLVTTPQPYDENNLSSYGYVSSSTVNFRQSASTSSTRLATLRQYAFCLVLGTTQSNGTTWYKVNYGGKVGYIQGDYFKQLTIAELQDFLLSNEYKQGIANNSSSSSGSSGSTSGGTSNLPSAEDQTVQEWTNPNSGINVSYEPFDPFATPEPLVTASPPASASPSAEATTLEPLETLPVEYPTEDTESGEGGSAVGWVLAAAVVLLGGGGGGYAYVLHKQNQRRAAQRAAQRRAAAQRTGESANRPYARTGTAAQPRTGTYNAGGTATPTQRPSTTTTAGTTAAGAYGAAKQARRPYAGEGSTASSSGTNPYANFQRPTTNSAGNYGSTQGTNTSSAGTAGVGNSSASSYGTRPASGTATSATAGTGSTAGTYGTGTAGASSTAYGATTARRTGASSYGTRTSNGVSTGAHGGTPGTQGGAQTPSTAKPSGTGIYGQPTGSTVKPGTSNADSAPATSGMPGDTTPASSASGAPVTPAQPKPTGASAYGSQRRSAANGQPVRRAPSQDNVDFHQDNDSDL